MRVGLPAVVVGAAGVLVTGLVWWGSLDQLGSDPDTAANRLVPTDGQRTVTRTEDDRVQVSETARLTGVEMILTSPPFIGNALGASLDGSPFDWRIWRTTLTGYDVVTDESGEQSTTLYRLTDDGVEQLAAYGAFDLVFDPPLLALPDDVHDGSTWSGAGDASPDGYLTYELDSTAEETGDDGCLRVTGALELYTDDEPFHTIDVGESWCPGGTGLSDGEERVDPPELDGSTSPQVGLAVGAEDWEAHPRRLVVATSLDSAQPDDPAAPASIDFAPSGTAGGDLTISSSTTGDVIGFRAQQGNLVRAWVGHPGGDVTAVATAGEVSVVGTSRRELVAYGERGQYLWAADLGGVPVTAPVAVDEDHLVATTVTGDVVALDPASGEQLWRDRMTDQIRVPPVSDGDALASADQAGRLVVHDLDSGDPRWSADLDGVSAMDVVGRVLVVRTPYSVLGFDLDDGTRRWSTRLGGAVNRAAVVELGRTVGVASQEETVGIDRDTGEIEWRRPGADRTIGVDSRLVQVTDDEVVVRDDDGDLLNRIDIDLPSPGTPWLSAADAGVWVVDPTGTVLEVSP